MAQAIPGFLTFFADSMCCVPCASTGPSRIRWIICKNSKVAGVNRRIFFQMSTRGNFGERLE